MKIEQANAVPLTFIFDKLNVKPVKQRNQDYWYHSPLRNERTASFKINTSKNLWYDFGEGKGGDAVAFVCAYLNSINEADTVSDALRWISTMSGHMPAIRPIQYPAKNDDDKALVLKEIELIEHRLLVRYLDSRGIPLALAQHYLQELRIYNKQSRKTFFALGLANEEKGYELRNQFFKGCLGKKAITFIRGQVTKPSGIHIFEGFMDFLSALSAQKLKQFKDDAIILNSLSCLQSATPYIKGYGYTLAYSWMDNDKAGMQARQALHEFFKTEEHLQHKPMNAIYKGHKDVNAWHMHKLGLGA